VTGAALRFPVQTSVGNYFISNYPPFSCWSADNVPGFVEALKQPPAAVPGTGAPGPLGLYVHIPFCRQRCHYCYFRVYPRRKSEDVDLYIDSILKELGLYLKFPGFQARPFSSVYFGGGSPSYLSAEQIQRLLGGLQERSPWD